MVFIRHGLTSWNERNRIQGRTDVELSQAGKTQVSQWRIPLSWKNHNWASSPLLRAKQTAKLLGAQNLRIENALVEMNWGDWEGKTLHELRNSPVEQFQINENRGLDFQPANGETPRLVIKRLKNWVSGLTENDLPLIAVTHKGVIRAALSLATGWDMKSNFPQKLDWECAHVFSCKINGGLKIERINVPLPLK